MKAGLILLGLMFFPVFVNADGYLSTQQWWEAVEHQGAEYSEYIKDIYDKKGSSYCDYLRKEHPKSSCGSTVLLNLPPARIKFDKDFMVTQITVQEDRLKMNYIFQRFTSERSFIVYLGRNKIALRIDGEEGPRYIQATLPDVVLKARQVAKAEGIKMPRHFYIHHTLNEIYKYQYSHTNIDMHQFMVDIITDKEFRAEVFSNVNLVRYLSDSPITPAETKEENKDLTLEGTLKKYDIKISDKLNPTGGRYAYISMKNYKIITTQQLATVSEYYQVKVLD